MSNDRLASRALGGSLPSNLHLGLPTRRRIPLPDSRLVHPTLRPIRRLPLSTSESHSDGPATRRPLDRLTRQSIVQRWWTTRCSLRDLADEFGVSHMTVYRLVHPTCAPPAQARA